MTDYFIVNQFQSEDLRAILEEINIAFQENHQDALKFQETRDKTLFPMIGYRHALLQRNLRCTLAYLYNRLMKLKEIRWHLGPVITPDIKEALTEPEIQWFNNYSKLLTNYMTSFPEAINLMTDIKPPKALFIEVKCVIDHGKLELENGETVLLQKNSIHYLPRTECEHLIRQGILEHISY
jgi:GINS complex subunit 1